MIYPIHPMIPNVKLQVQRSNVMFFKTKYIFEAKDLYQASILLIGNQTNEMHESRRYIPLLEDKFA